MSPIKHEERVEIRVPTEDLERWRATADAERMSLSAWIRFRCNQVAVDAETIAVVDRKERERKAAAKKASK